MEVVLRQDVDHVGLRGEVVNVARGYARNYLLPRGLAELATPGLKRELERREAIKSRNEAKDTGEAEAIAKKIEATELKFEMNAGPTGALFGSVTATNVVDRLWDEQKIRLDRRKLGLQTIKRIGRYTVPVEVFTDVTAELRILVTPEGGELPPEQPEVTEAPAETPTAEAPLAEAPAPEAAIAEEPAAEAAPAEPEAAAPEPVAEAAVADEPAAEQPAAAAGEPSAVAPEPEAPVLEELPEAEEPAEATAAEAAADEPADEAPASEPTAEDETPATGDDDK